MLLSKKISAGYVLGLFFLFFLTCNHYSSGQNINDLLAGFKNPPVTARPKGYWCWPNGNFDLKRITYELKDSKDKGMGGYDIWDVNNLRDYDNKVPAGPPFMGEESTNAIVHAIKEATRINFELGLAVASSWNSGGSWVTPENGVMGILDTSITIGGNQHVEIEFPFPELPKSNFYGSANLLLDTLDNGMPTYYKEIAMLAIPKGKQIIPGKDIIDLSSGFRNGILTCDLPAGKWLITRYICTGLGTGLKQPSPNSEGRMIDHFSKEAQHNHLQFFIDKLRPQLGDLSKTALKYLYNDSYEIRGNVWTPKMLTEFKARRGYDMKKYLPAINGKIIDNPDITRRFLYDYAQTLSDIMIDNHYRYGKEFCNKYGLGYIAEGGGPGFPIHDVPVESIKALGALSSPRGEFWHKFSKYDSEGFDVLLFVKGIASAAHLYNQPNVEAESFTSLMHWQESWQDLKPTADRAFCEGLNRVVYHTSNHSPDKFGVPGYVYGFGTHFDTRQTWWPKARAWNDYLARCSYLLQQGNFVGDILYYYGDQAPNFVKQRHIEPGLGFGYDYDVINTEKLLELDVIDGKLCLSQGQQYALLVLPEKEDMPLQVLQKIETLLQKGALVSGTKPTTTPGLYNYVENDRQLNVLANRLWKNIDKNHPGYNLFGKGKLYCGVPQREILLSNYIFPDFNYKGKGDSTGLNFIHRRFNETEIYFIRNTKNKGTTAECVFRVKDKIPELWIPETGEVFKDIVFHQEGDSTRLALSFDPFDSFFIVFTDSAKKTIQQKILKDGEIIFPAKERYCQLGSFNVNQNMFVQPGEYTIESNGKVQKTQRVGSSEIFRIEGDWELTFPKGYGAQDSAVFPELISLTESAEPGIKYFSGIATYKINFTFVPLQKDKKYILNLGKVKDLADVRLNGDSLGIVWHPPFELDITHSLREGINQLSIDVANTWNNRLVGDDRLPENDRTTNTNIVNGPEAWGKPWAEVPLKESGLIGPVNIKYIEDK